MMRLSLINKKTLTTLALLCLLPFAANAQPIAITETQPLSFGTFAIGDFSTVMNVRIRNNGTFTTGGPVTMLIDPTRGLYTLSGGVGVANIVYTITTPATITLTGAGSTFTMNNIRVRPNTLRFNGAGNDNIRVAARIVSPGDGVAFGDGTYTGSLDLNVAF